MDPWYKVVTPRREVREGRSFDPNEFAIALEKVVEGTAPPDYSDPVQFFSRTVFTTAFKQHVGLVLRRLDGQTANTAPVMALVTQFGGGKTHLLTSLYHLLKTPEKCLRDERVKALLEEIGVSSLPKTKVAVFVGNAWDPREGRETPWIDLAQQLAGDKGVAALGPEAAKVPPGTVTLDQLFEAAGGRVLILFDETLNFLNRHRGMAEPFFAFLQNLARSMTGTKNCAAVLSLPKSPVEMTTWELEWQERITHEVRRVARELLVNEVGEIAEVVRRRLFDDLGPESKRRAVAKAYADWCFERRAQLPPEWTAVDTLKTDAKAREHLQQLFESCYPFHPATLHVFQRKWQTLPPYQQTRGTLAMLAQWVSWTYREGFEHARKEPLITLGSAPLEDPSFRTLVLGQLGENKLGPAITTDLAGERTHAGALDADTKGPLKDIHRRAGTAILFESSGGMAPDKVALIQEIRFDLGEPDLDTTSIDAAADALERRAYYLRKVGRDGYRFWHQPRLKKVVGDKRAALDPEEVLKTLRAMIRDHFNDKKAVPVDYFPSEGSGVGDVPRLTLWIIDPETPYDETLRARLAEWTRTRGETPRSYPAALVWCARKSGRELLDKVELLLAWKRVNDDLKSGRLGGEFDANEKQQVLGEIRGAEEDVHDAVWAAYRYVLVYDAKEGGLRASIDMGAGHASAGESLTARILVALRSEGLLGGETVGAGYVQRNWPGALKESGAWPLAGLRKAFVDGSLVRLPDPEKVLVEKVAEFVQTGAFGLGSGQRADGTFERVWFKQPIGPEEVTFDSGTFLLFPTIAESLLHPLPEIQKEQPPASAGAESKETTMVGTPSLAQELVLKGQVPSEQWNVVGRKLITTLRDPTLSDSLSLTLEVKVSPSPEGREQLKQEVRKVLKDLDLKDWTIEGG